MADGRVHVGSKVVTRYEVWCDDCPYSQEFADRSEAQTALLDHVRSHVDLGRHGRPDSTP